MAKRAVFILAILIGLSLVWFGAAGADAARGGRQGTRAAANPDHTGYFHEPVQRHATVTNVFAKTGDSLKVLGQMTAE